jgi:hypothetical protein
MVSEVHPIKFENMPAYKKNNPIGLVFVVPDDIYNNFKYQDIVTKDKTSKTFRKVIKLDSKLKNMQQWVLKVDINTDKSSMFAKTGVTLGVILNPDHHQDLHLKLSRIYLEQQKQSQNQDQEMFHYQRQQKLIHLPCQIQI